MSGIQDKDAAEELLSKMARVGRRAQIAINVCFVLYLIVIAIALVASILAVLESSSISVSMIIGGLSRLFAVATVAVLFVVLSQLFRDMSESKSPFTKKQANRILLMGVISFLNVAFGAVSSLFAPISTELGDISAGFVSTPMTLNLHIDVPSLLMAITCFCLSYVFRYGALLQWLQDETL